MTHYLSNNAVSICELKYYPTKVSCFDALTTASTDKAHVINYLSTQKSRTGIPDTDAALPNYPRLFLAYIESALVRVPSRSCTGEAIARYAYS